MLLWFHHALFYRVLSILSPTQIIACFKIFFVIFSAYKLSCKDFFKVFYGWRISIAWWLAGPVVPQFIKDQIPGMTFRVLAIYSKEGDLRVDTKTFLWARQCKNMSSQASFPWTFESVIFMFLRVWGIMSIVYLLNKKKTLRVKFFFSYFPTMHFFYLLKRPFMREDLNMVQTSVPGGWWHIYYIRWFITVQLRGSE